MNGNNVLKVAAVPLAIGLVLGFAGGWFAGKSRGERKTTEALQPIVDLIFPPPPVEVFALTGVIKEIVGATIALEVNDPEDYLPRLDGSEGKKQNRFASVFSNTTYALYDWSNLDREGFPAKKELKLSDLKPGDTVTVRSGENIKSAQKFDVTEIELVKY